MMGPAYWHFTVNELGEQDLAAQLDHIHVMKCRELNEPASPSRAQAEPHARRHLRQDSAVIRIMCCHQEFLFIAAAIATEAGAVRHLACCWPNAGLYTDGPNDASLQSLSMGKLT